MFNLTEIMNAAQSGQAFQNLASQYGVTPQQAEAAVQSFLPGLSMGLQNKAGTPDGFASLLELMTGQAHLKAFTGQSAPAEPETVEAGKDALGTIFGSNAAQQAISQHAATMSGISNSIMNAMMPAITSMIVGGLFKGAANSGLGGMLGQMMPQMSQPAAQAGMPAGGLAGMWSQMMGQMMGAAPPQPAQPAGPTPMQAGLEMFQAMLNHGQQVHETQAKTLQTIFETMVKR